MSYKPRRQKGDRLGALLRGMGPSTTVPSPFPPPPPALTITDTPSSYPSHVPFFQGVLRQPTQVVPQTSPQALSTFLLPKQGRVGKTNMIPAGSFSLKVPGTEEEITLQFFYVDDKEHGRRIFVRNNMTQQRRISGYVTKEFIDKYYKYLDEPNKNLEFYPQFKTLKDLKIKFTMTGSWYALYPPNTDHRFSSSLLFKDNPPMYWGNHGENLDIFHHLLLWLGINPTVETSDVGYLQLFLQKLQTKLFEALMNCPLLWTAMTHFEAYILAKKEKKNIFYTLLDDNLEDVRYRIYKMTPQGKRSYYNLESYFDNRSQKILTQGPNPFQRIQQKRVQQQDQIQLPLLQQQRGSRTEGGGSRTEGGGGGGGVRQQSQTDP